MMVFISSLSDIGARESTELRDQKALGNSQVRRSSRGLIVAAGPRRLGNRQTGDGDKIASHGLSDLLAVAITPSRTPQNERRNPGADPWDEPRHQGTIG
jgi:hypothetical protein